MLWIVTIHDSLSFVFQLQLFPTISERDSGGTKLSQNGELESGETGATGGAVQASDSQAGWTLLCRVPLAGLGCARIHMDMRRGAASGGGGG